MGLLRLLLLPARRLTLFNRTKQNDRQGIHYGALGFLLLCLLLHPATHAQEATVLATAETAARNWLQWADAGDYAATWQQSAALFQARVTPQEWQRLLHQARTPLGRVVTRTLKSAHATRTLPGVPEGEYLVLQFETAFAQGTRIETITPVQEPSGTWKVSGYYLRE